ncbi:hypothetical protein PSI17_16440 [Xenorhabdus sp. IM139775]|nr:hypothetical protein [Xenorhabdus sp. IM139775]MDC9595133.1 hypothetical protein [Xenorhabdus sp. IM139775]
MTDDESVDPKRRHANVSSDAIFNVTMPGFALNPTIDPPVTTAPRQLPGNANGNATDPDVTSAGSSNENT